MPFFRFDFPVKKLEEALETSEVYCGSEAAPLIIRKRIAWYQVVQDDRILKRSKYLSEVVHFALSQFDVDSIYFRTSRLISRGV
jgi:hypothetical protein